MRWRKRYPSIGKRSDGEVDVKHPVGPGSHIIVWDLDGTLGEFKSLEKVHAHPDPASPIRISLRPGIRECLSLLAREGFVHCLLTVATPRYAQIALRVAGVTDLFARVEGRGQRGKGDAAGIALEFGLPEQEWPHRMMFMGDHPIFDMPRDPRILFHFEPQALLRTASELARLVLHLRSLGKGSLLEGFDRILDARPWRERFGQVLGRRGNDGLWYRKVKGLGTLALDRRPQECPVIAFAEPAHPSARPEECEVTPEALDIASQ